MIKGGKKVILSIIPLDAEKSLERNRNSYICFTLKVCKVYVHSQEVISVP